MGVRRAAWGSGHSSCVYFSILFATLCPKSQVPSPKSQVPGANKRQASTQLPSFLHVAHDRREHRHAHRDTIGHLALNDGLWAVRNFR